MYKESSAMGWIAVVAVAKVSAFLFAGCSEVPHDHSIALKMMNKTVLKSKQGIRIDKKLKSKVTVFHPTRSMNYRLSVAHFATII